MAKEIRLDGPIGMMMNGSEMFQMNLNELDLKDEDRLTVVINSPGGSVIEGWGIYNQLKSLNNPVDVRIEGLAASIASLIALAGDTVKMSEVGSFMIHRASTQIEGNQEDLKKSVETLNTIDETLINVYMAATNESREVVEEWMDQEKWFTPEKALEVGFVDEIINKVDAKMAALYYPKNKTMTKFEKLMAYLNGDEATPEVATPEDTPEIETGSAEDQPVAELDEGQMDQVASMIGEALAPLIARIEALEPAEDAEEETDEERDAKLDDRIEEKIKAIVRGIGRSTGTPPQANANMDGEPVYISPNQKHNNRMREIEAKTRL
jgi:ATP-dependent protease ClpP protease subunit